MGKAHWIPRNGTGYLAFDLASMSSLIFRYLCEIFWNLNIVSYVAAYYMSTPIIHIVLEGRD